MRTATTELEISQLREALKTQHYLGAGRPAGHVLWQGVYQTSTEEGIPSLCAVLCWAGAALRLKDRDEWLDWDPLTRANRLALVVQLRRFLVLEERRKPNLASRCLGLAMRRLPEQWEARHGKAGSCADPPWAAMAAAGRSVAGSANRPDLIFDRPHLQFGFSRR